MSTLHYICMTCHREYGTLEVARDLGALNQSHGFCPECAAVKLDEKLQGLHGVVTGVFAKRWCRCGREILTGKSLCEFCETQSRVESIDERLHRAAGGHSGDDYPSREAAFDVEANR